jgi:hypothetical protein
VERDQGRVPPDQAEVPETKRESAKDRLSSLLDRSKPVQIEGDRDERELDTDLEKDIGHDIDRGEGHSL